MQLPPSFARVLLGWLVVILAPQTSCREDGPERRRVVVFAASSLREVFRDIAGDFESAHGDVQIVFQFAGSHELRAQLDHGAPADVVVTADSVHMEALGQAGRVGEPVVIAANTPVVITAPRSPVQTLFDLPRATRIAVGIADVPIGRYTNDIIGRVDARHPGFRAEVEARIVTREPNVRQVLARVVMGEADAGVVYATDVTAPDTRLRVVPIPESFSPPVLLVAAVVRAAPEPELAARFVSFLTGAAARARFDTAGFRSPPATH